MSKIEIRLEYQKETGDALGTINRIAENNRPNVQNYIEWLEEKLSSLQSLKLILKHEKAL